MAANAGSGLGLVDAHNVITMLHSTGITIDADGQHLIGEMADHVAARTKGGAADVLGGFLAPHADALSQRWAAVVAAHLYDGQAPVALPRPRWTIPGGCRGRPLTRLEQAICRVTVRRWPHGTGTTPAQYALAEQSATSGELSKLRTDAVTIRAAAQVHLPGGRDQAGRLVELDEWGTRLLIDRMANVDPSLASTPFVYDGAEPGTSKAQASASGNLARVLHIAGLGEDSTLNPTSIRNTCARRTYERGDGIEAAAEAMGCRSLDRIRRIITSQPVG